VARDPEPDPLEERARALWELGDYAPVGELLDGASEAAVAAAGISPGMEVLDVATGTGNAAIRAARAGARVVALDLTPAMIARARERARAEGLEVEWVEGNAERLPFPDGRFDAVLSVFGAMLAPRPERVAPELFRVVRPGGAVAMATWPPEGFSGRLMELFRRAMPPPPEVPSPLEWGREDVVRAGLGPFAERLDVEKRVLRWDFPSADAAHEVFERNAVGHVLARQELSRARYAELMAEARELVRASGRAGRRFELDSEYLLVVGRAARPPADGPGSRR